MTEATHDEAQVQQLMRLARECARPLANAANWYVLESSIRNVITQQRTREAEQQAEIERLTVCLKKANDGFEEFERKWYLRGDEIFRLREALRLAEAAMNYMGDVLNNMDAVEPEDLAITKPAFEAARAALNHTQGAKG